MPRRPLRTWLDPFPALQALRALAAGTARRATGPVSGLARALRAAVRAAAEKVRAARAEARSAATRAAERAALRAKPELTPMDWRNPPSETLTAVAVPLVATAAALTAASYLVAELGAREQALASEAGSARPLAFDDAARAVGPVALDFAPEARAEAGAGGETAESSAAAVELLDPPGGDPLDDLGTGGSAPGDGLGGLTGPFGPNGSEGGAGSGPGSSTGGLGDGGDSGGGLGGVGGDGSDGSFLTGPNGPGSGGTNGGASTNGGTGGTGGAGESGDGSVGGLGGGAAGTGGSGAPVGVTPPDRFDTGAAPTRFVSNAGQWADGTDFAAAGPGYRVALSASGFAADLSRAPTEGERKQGAGESVTDRVTVRFAGTDPRARAEGTGRLESVSHFYTGSDPADWRTNVAEYAGVRYAGAYPGADLLYRAADGGTVEFAFELAPGADARAIGFTVEGATARVDERGRLVLTTAAGAELVQTAPVAFHEGESGAAADRTSVQIGYAVRADGSIGFAVEGADPGRALVIDPALTYATTVGARVNGLAADGAGNAYAAGTNGTAAVVWKVGPTGSVAWTATLGGVGTAAAIARGPDGTLYVAGSSTSGAFPVTTGAYDTTRNGGTDAFLALLTGSGTLTAATYLGSSNEDYGYGVAVDPRTGEAVVVGQTGVTVPPVFPPPPPSPPVAFPTVAAAQPAPNGVDGFVTRFNASASGLVFSTYRGGAVSDAALGVAVDSTGAAVVVGTENDLGFVYRYSAIGIAAAGVTTSDAQAAVAVDDRDRVYVTGGGFTRRYATVGATADYTILAGGSAIAVDGTYEPVVVGTASGLQTARYLADGSGTVWTDTPYGGSAVGYAAAVGGGLVFAGGINGSGSGVVRAYGPPLAPAITALADDTGSSNSDRLTKDTTLSASGTAPASSTVSVYQQRADRAVPTLLGTTTASAGGLWTYALATTTDDNAYHLTATATVSGYVSAVSAPLTYTLDTTAPEVGLTVPSVTTDRQPPVLVVASDLNDLSAPATVTLDADLNADGDFADAGETGYATGTLVNGGYRFTTYTPLAVGALATFRARVTDRAGNEGTSGSRSVFVLGSGSGPAAPAITGVATDTGASNADRITNQSALTVSGTSVAGATVTLFAQGPFDPAPVPVGTATASGGGTWSIGPVAPLAEGAYALTARATVSGAASVPSATVVVTVDVTAPTVVLTAPDRTQETVPLLTVRATDAVGFAAPTTITLDADLNADGDFADAGETGYASAALANGTATFTGYTAFSTGTKRLRASATDLAGNQKYSSTRTIEIVAAASVAAPAITTIADDTGASNADRVTRDSDLTVSGTAPSGSSVTLYRRGPNDAAPVTVGTAVATGGVWSLSTGALEDGAHAFTARAAVTSPPPPAYSNDSAAVVATVDTVAPVVVARAPLPGASPELVVTATDGVGFPAPATVTLDLDLNGDGAFDGVGEVGYATAALSGGAATFAVSPPLAPGTYRARARVTDLAGNEGTSVSVPIEVPEAAWAARNLTPQVRSGYGGRAGWTTAADALAYAGDVSAAHAVDTDLSPTAVGGQATALVYHSQEAAPAPVVQVLVTSDNALAVPTAVTGTLTWDGTAVATPTYDVSQLSAGGEWVFAAAPGGTPATGRHTFTLDLFLDYTGTMNDRTVSVTGYTFVANRSASPYGAGWSLSAVDTLTSVTASGAFPAGVLRQFGGGGWAFYASAGGGAYTAPPGDGGTLVASGGGWVHTDWDGTVRTFDSSGRMTGWASVDGYDVYTYTYDASGGVATVANPDGSTATFSYASGKLSQVAAPGSRTTSATITGGNLLQLTQPGGGTHTFTYSANRLAGETYGTGTSAYTYDGTGLARTVKAGADPVGTVTAAQGAGLGTAARAGVGGTVSGAFQDGTGATTATAHNRFGQAVYTRAADGGERFAPRSSGGWVVAATDPLKRTTAYTVRADGRVTGEFRADGTFATWAYSNYPNPDLYGLVGYTDFRGRSWTYALDGSARRTFETDPLGRVSSYTWAGGDRLETETDPFGFITTYHYDTLRRPDGALRGGAPTGTVGYDSYGYASVFTDPRGNRTTVTNDAMGRAVGTLNAKSERTTATFDAAGRLLTSTDGRANLTSYTMDAAGRTRTATEAAGTGLQRTTTYAYDGAGRLVETLDPLGRRATVVYEAVGRVRATVDPLGYRTTNVYDLAGQLSYTRDPLNRLTGFGYDRLGRLVSTTDAAAIAGGSYADGGIATMVYDGNSNAVASVDPLGNRTTAVFDALNRPVAVIDATGARATTYYDPSLPVVATTDARGFTTTSQYDERGNLRQVEYPAGEYSGSALVLYEYDAADNLKTITDERGKTSTIQYDALNRPHEWTDAENNTTTAVYDAAGNLSASVDAFGKRTTFAYDALNRQTGTLDPLGNRTTAVFDAGDRVTAASDPRGNATYFGYDALDRLTDTLDARGNLSTRGYDPVGNLTGTTDAKGKRSSFAYDALNRLVETTDPTGAKATTLYDKASRVRLAFDPRGNATVYDRDAVGRVRTVVTADGTGDELTTGYGYDGNGNLVSTTDPSGAVWTNTYDARNRLKEQTNPLNQTATTLYDAAGNVSLQIDGRGNRTTFVYDDANRLTERRAADGGVWTTLYDRTRADVTIDPLGRITQLTFDDLGRTLSQIEGYGTTEVRTTGYTYDSAGNLRTVTDTFGRTTTYGYDERNLRNSVTDPTGNVWLSMFDANGREWLRADPLGRDTRTYFDAAGRPEATRDALGQYSYTVYDAAGNVIATMDAAGSVTETLYDAQNRPYVRIDALANRTTTTFDSAGRVLSVKDARNVVTSYQYDALGRVFERVDAFGTAVQRSTVSDYDANGNLSYVIDGASNATLYEYDALNRRVVTQDPTGALWTRTYDTAGNLKTKTDPVGTNRTTTFNYDALNRLIETVDPLGNVSTIAYSTTGPRTETAVDPRGNRTTTTYDVADRVSAVAVYANGAVQRTTSLYDTAGQLRTVIDPLTKRTTFGYDARGLRTSATDPLNHTTTTHYDELGRVRAVEDALAHRTTTVYDKLGRVLATVDANGFRTTSVFDAVGNRTALVDPLGNRTTWTYDELNRATAEQNVSGTATFAYDAADRLEGTTDKLNRRRAFGYDAAGRKTSEVWLTSGGATVQLQTWTYDAAGRLLTAQDHDGTSTYAYYATNRVESAHGPFGAWQTYAYDGAGNREGVTDSTGAVTTVTFDERNRQASERSAGTGIAAVRFDYAYTNRGQRDSVTRYSDVAGTTLAGTTTHAYDDAGRHTGTTHKNAAGTALLTLVYAYDIADRLEARTDRGVTTSYQYDSANRLKVDGAQAFDYDAAGNRDSAGYTTDPGNRITSDGTWNYTHDTEGNVTKRTKAGETWVYAYDHRNQLLTAKRSATDPGAATAIVTYAYDAGGRRVSREAWDGTTTTVERYALDGADPAKPRALGAEGSDVYAVLDGTNAVVGRWVSGVGFDEQVARRDAGGSVGWFLTDRQGSARLAVSSAGTALASAAWDGYGVAAAGSTRWGGIGFAGVRHDDLTNLDSNGHGTREYFASAGVWLQSDPRWPLTGEANPYVYVRNNPTNLVDPSGYQGDEPGLDSPYGRHVYEALDKLHASDDPDGLVPVGNGQYRTIRGILWSYYANTGESKFWFEKDQVRWNRVEKYIDLIRNGPGDAPGAIEPIKPFTLPPSLAPQIVERNGTLFDMSCNTCTGGRGLGPAVRVSRPSHFADRELILTMIQAKEPEIYDYIISGKVRVDTNWEGNLLGRLGATHDVVREGGVVKSIAVRRSLDVNERAAHIAATLRFADSNGFGAAESKQPIIGVRPPYSEQVQRLRNTFETAREGSIAKIRARRDGYALHNFGVTEMRSAGGIFAENFADWFGPTSIDGFGGVWQITEGLGTALALRPTPMSYGRIHSTEYINGAPVYALRKEALYQATTPAHGTFIYNQNGLLIGRFARGQYLEVLPLPGEPVIHGGNFIYLGPNTTAVAGVLRNVNVIADRGVNPDGTFSGLTLAGQSNPGGIDILRSARWTQLQNEHRAIRKTDPERFWKLVTDQFWEQANRPWLDAAIARGSSFKLVSNPSDILATHVTNKAGTEFVRDASGNPIRSIFGREVDYLKSKGFTILPDGTVVKSQLPKS